jgi:sec-independent protein translocase protein TatA
MFGLGFLELLIIFFIMFLLFGVKNIPRLGAGLGEGIRNFTGSLKGGDDGAATKKDAAGDKPTGSV